MNPSALAFAEEVITPADVAGKRVIETGSLDVNGSVRPHVEALDPASYTGTDVQAGPGVDRICAAADLVAELGAGSGDLVISTEMLEHVEDWRAAVRAMVAVLAPGGLLVLTTRSMGFPYHHPFPGDYHRFSVRAMECILHAAGLDIIRCEPDVPEAPGVLAAARKPEGWAEPPRMDDDLAAVIPGPAVRVNGLQGPDWT